MTRSVTTAFCAAALYICALQSAQAADSFPNRAVRMIIPFPVGGATDILARVVAQKSAEQFGQQVVVDNRPGAGGTLGSRIAVTATADGYTLLMGTTSTHAIGPHLYAKPPYDSLADFSPVTQVATSPNVLLVGSQSTGAIDQGTGRAGQGTTWQNEFRLIRHRHAVPPLR